jgi:opacity protein-like surface antigen
LGGLLPVFEKLPGAGQAGIIAADLAVARMSIFAGRLGLALVLAALCPGGRTAHAQTAPVPYWTSSWPAGFGGDLATGEGSSTYGNFPSFDGSSRGGSSNTRYNFPNGWFVGSESRGFGLSMNGISQMGAFGNRSLSYDGVQFGYNFKNPGLPVTVYAGFDTLKYNTGIGSPFSPFDTQSGTLPGYSAHAGVEIKPTSNLSLSLGFGVTQQPQRSDSDINSLALPGAPPLALGIRR